ncbi:MAG TPA: efflux RND transporter periplasmic adaptor subunit [Povalibacter sp.]|uniref:efflux RND transporter periplasmic adaptor subunit n=1 Tax=Povalibacter sp. TaxID=1962978 RepID=UPI002CA470F2|nr:efflux RND transporter periplasmic adaptor subunit [Povalibacter sp.]HMN45599.1 efflux RND transporter periplasmic adaptor subunit [Povalibacter sp.]
MSLDQNALDSLRIERGPEPSSDSGKPYKGFLIIVLAIAIAAAAWALLRNPAVEVETATAVAAAGASGGGSAVLNASGYVVARRQATVSSKVTGKVAEVMIEEGMNVKEGQLIARLDDSTAKQTYALSQRQLESARIKLEEVKVRLAEAERTLRRNEQLRADKLVSESQLDASQSEVAATRARLESLRSDVEVAEGTLRVRAQDLEDLLVRAPFDGVVVSKDAQPGEMVSPISAGGGFTRTGIATIVDMSSREIEVDVNEAFINRVQDEQKTEAVLDAYPDWTIPSHVINIVPTADRQKATVRVRIGFDALDPRILPDMGVKVSFLENRGVEQSVATRPSVRLPATAVIREGDTSYVWRVQGDEVERVAVRTGGERDGQIEVLSGINAGDTVVATPVEGLKDGGSIKQKSG